MNLFLRISKNNKKNNQGAVIIRPFLLSLNTSKHILLLCVFTCRIHIMSECTFCDCMTVKKLLSQDRLDIWRLTSTVLERTTTDIVNKHTQPFSQTGWMFVHELSDMNAVIYFITLFNISPYFHVIVLVFLYSWKLHSTLTFELLETQILKTYYWYQKCVEKNN